MLLSLVTSSVDYPLGWILLSSVLGAMGLYILSVKSLGTWSATHAWLLTGLHVLTPTAESLHQIITTVNQTNSSRSGSRRTEDALAMMKSIEFHHSTIGPGSLTIQAIQQQQQQQQTGSTSSQDPRMRQLNQRQNLPQHPMLQLWKHLEAFVCMAVGTVFCGLAIQVTMRIKDMDSTKSAVLGMSWWWWLIGLMALQTTHGLVQTMVTVSPRLHSKNSTNNAVGSQSGNIESPQPSWFLFLLQTSPRSVFHGLLAAAVATFASSSSSLRNSPEWYQEMVIRLQLWWNLVVVSKDNASASDSTLLDSWFIVSALKLAVVFAVIFTIIMAVAEPVNVLQSSLWNVMYRRGTLKQQLIGNKHTSTTRGGSLEESASSAAPNEVESSQNPKTTLATRGFWSARMACFNLLIMPASILASDMLAAWAYGYRHRLWTSAFSNASQNGVVDMMLVLIWVVTLSLQMHSLLQDYLLGALLLCVDMLKKSSFAREQQTVTLTRNEEEKQNDGTISSSSLDWISNVFANRPTGLLLTRATQYVIWPVLLLMLVIVAMTTTASSTLNFQKPALLSPVVYQVASPYGEPWQNLLKWNQNQFDLATSRDGAVSGAGWFAKETWDLLSPQALPTSHNTEALPLLSLCKKVQTYAIQAQDDPEMRQILTSSGEGVPTAPGSVHHQVQETLQQLRFVLAMLCQHSIFSQRVLYLLAYTLLKVLCIYWLACALLAWIFGKDEFQRMADHSSFLQRTLRTNSKRKSPKPRKQQQRQQQQSRKNAKTKLS